MRRMDGQLNYPHLDTHWWLFHTAHYMSRIHMDADGAATVVVIPPCPNSDFPGKLWIIGRPKGENGDVRYTTGVSNDYDPAGANSTIFDYEAIMLMPGDRL